MKLPSIENSAAAGATSALLILKAVQAICLSFTVILRDRFQLDTLLSVILSILMLGAGVMVILGARWAWKLGWFCVVATLVWYSVVTFQHSSLLRQFEYLIEIGVALILLFLISARLVRK